MRWHHVGIEVTNLEKSIIFYKEVLGFDIEQTMQLDGEKIVFLKRDSLRIELVEAEEITEKSTRVHFSWEVARLTDWITCLEKYGYLPIEGPFDVRNGWKTVFFAGPAGETIEFIETT